ncbi:MULTISPECIES: DUF4307 domain-containing protein [Mycetocola]|uniref:DUF4307 domain-containing protein n=1 Tax=Mycetocola lacteus TaxID=76637 RepID=A0A3L7AM97_9MICO|nr:MULTISPECIES: DUF4307 domain-containing protein [Mycetocola]MCS4275445.1 hypothetical protein [Mycetocola sp. BIGb0189]RLP80860.1 DUF4307 domain-containing protein [Mycetocola lacteus]RLP84645.1 DUF4307 domain-containing protein [Mycetocola lacteus]
MSLPSGQATSAPESALDQRYGRTKRTGKRDRRILVIAAAAFAVVLGAWVVWGALDGPSASLESRDTAHIVIDEHNVQITFQVTAPENTRVECALQALDPQFTVVGWKIIELDPATVPVRQFTQHLKTTQLATTGIVKNCWIPEAS